MVNGDLTESLIAVSPIVAGIGLAKICLAKSLLFMAFLVSFFELRLVQFQMSKSQYDDEDLNVSRRSKLFCPIE